MKFALICSAALLVIGLAGCGTLREQQNPQPRTQTPCREWIVLSQTSASSSAAQTSTSAPVEKESTIK